MAQGRRLTPRVQQLSAALQAGRVGPDDREADPQLIVVFDVAGSVAGFARAVEQVPGLEFLASSLTTRSSRTTIATDTLPYGYAPLRNAFRQCRDLRAWGPDDRVRETGLLAAWQETVAVVGATNTARVEIELWFRGAEAARASAQDEVSRAVGACGGTVITSSVVVGIGYHAVLADIPYDEVKRILRDGPAAMDLLPLRHLHERRGGPRAHQDVPGLETDPVGDAGGGGAPGGPADDRRSSAGRRCFSFASSRIDRSGGAA
jgi:hypothetical protein